MSVNDAKMAPPTRCAFFSPLNPPGRPQAFIGSLPANSHNFKKLLKKGSVAVIVGGIAEMYMQVQRAALFFSRCCLA